MAANKKKCKTNTNSNFHKKASLDELNLRCILCKPNKGCNRRGRPKRNHGKMSKYKNKRG